MTAAASRLQELIAVARDGSGDKRRDLLRGVADVFAAAPHEFSPLDLQHLDAIMTRISENADPLLRRELAEKLAGVPTAPRGLMRQLARDAIEVAAPALSRAAALNDEDLIDIIRQRGPDHMRAIIARPELSEAVTAELVERGDEETLVALALNMGARFSGAAMQKLVGHARRMKALQHPMTARHDLPAALLTRMYFFASAAVKREILKRSDVLDPALVDEAITANRRKIFTAGVTADLADARHLVQERAAAGQINERLLIDLLDTKRMATFLFAFAHLAGVDLPAARAILKDRTGEALALAGRATGLRPATFEKVFASLQRRGGDETATPRIFELYEKIPEEAAERVFRFWRVQAQSPDSDLGADGSDAETPRRRLKLHDLGSRFAG